MTEGQIVGIVLLILGGLQVVRADLLLKFQVWAQKVIMGADYIPGPRTIKIVRSLGVALMILGFLALTGAIE